MEDFIVRYIHFIGIIVLASMLSIQNVLLKAEVGNSTLKKLVRIDTVYGISAAITFIAGMLLWLSVGKPKEFYSANPIFHAKMGIFVLVALLSVVPTLFLLKNRKTTEDTIAVPKYVRIIKHVEMSFLVVLPLLAVLIAKGIGLSN